MSPSRGELWLRLVFSLFGLALMGVAAFWHGDGGIVISEFVVLAGLLFGGTTIWAIWKLVKARDHPSRR